MKTFEEWLAAVPSEAMRELAGFGGAGRSVPIEDVRRFALSDPEVRARCEESWATERDARDAAAGADYWEARDKRIRYGLVG